MKTDNESESLSSEPTCQPIVTLEECITADLVITGIYPLLCQNCRDKIRDAMVSLQLANAETFLERLDFMRFVKD